MSAVQLHPHAKLWNERDFDECCFPIGGVGRGTVVCGAPCSGAYCTTHRALNEQTYAAKPASYGPPPKRRKRPEGIATPVADEIVKDVCRAYCVTQDDLAGSELRYTAARQEAFARLHSTGEFSLQWIGRYFGGRHHTTVLEGIRRHRERLAA